MRKHIEISGSDVNAISFDGEFKNLRIVDNGNSLYIITVEFVDGSKITFEFSQKSKALSKYYYLASLYDIEVKEVPLVFFNDFANRYELDVDDKILWVDKRFDIIDKYKVLNIFDGEKDIVDKYLLKKLNVVVYAADASIKLKIKHLDTLKLMEVHSTITIIENVESGDADYILNEVDKFMEKFNN